MLVDPNLPPFFGVMSRSAVVEDLVLSLLVLIAAIVVAVGRAILSKQGNPDEQKEEDPEGEE